MIICFDVDGTLIDEHDRPVAEMVALAGSLSRDKGNAVVVWSGGGQSYAEEWCRRLGLEECYAQAKDRKVRVEDEIRFPDLVIDDEEGWGRLQLIVRRGNGPVIIGEREP